MTDAKWNHIQKRALQLQKERKARIEYDELHGYPNHDNDDLSHEEAEEEWNRENVTDDDDE